MADKRKKRKVKEDLDQPTKEELSVAKHLRFNVPCKDGKLAGSLPVKCFVASKAIECLLDSKWATNKGKTEALFTTRASCVDYCNQLLIKGIFHRATKVKKKKSDSKDKEEKPAKSKSTKKKEEEAKKSDEEPEAKKEEPKKKDEKKKKSEKKLKLEHHESQKFVDGDDLYVWIYDPTPLKNKIIGFFLVVGSIGVCLFPLWPPEVRMGVYYLSLVAAGLVASVFVLAILRGILFALIWLVTFGKHKFWLFPNLTEDCGVLESFVPFYTHEVVTPKDDTKTPAEKKIPDKDGDEKGSSGDLAAAVDGKQDGDDGKVSGDVSDATEHGDGDTVAEETNNIKAVENDNSSQPVEQNS